MSSAKSAEHSIGSKDSLGLAHTGACVSTRTTFCSAVAVLPQGSTTVYTRSYTKSPEMPKHGSTFGVTATSSQVTVKLAPSPRRHASNTQNWAWISPTMESCMSAVTTMLPLPS